MYRKYPAPQPKSRICLGRATSSSSWRIRLMFTPIHRLRSRYFGQSAPGSATAYRWRIRSNPTGSIDSMTRRVSSGNRFARSTLRVCFLALARLRPSTNFRTLWLNRTTQPCSEASQFQLTFHRVSIWKKLLWIGVAGLGTWAIAVLALSRGEKISALWIVIAGFCALSISYRFYSKWLATKVLVLNEDRAPPPVFPNVHKDFVPTTRL